MTLIAVVTGCADEPTTPSNTNIAGTWTANARLFSLTDFRISMTQAQLGLMNGTYTVRRLPPAAGCIVNVPCVKTGELVGRNTIAQVELELIGVGRFEGALVDQGKLRGILLVGTEFDTITFVRASP